MDMIQINLLPKEYRKRSGGFKLGKSGYYAIVAVAGIVFMIALVTVYQVYQLQELDEKIEVARYRTQQLQKDIALVDALTDVKNKIMQRMEAVDRLDRNRTVWVRILEDVNRRVPEFAWLSKFAEAEAPRTSASQQSDSTSVPRDPSERPFQIQGFSFTLNAVANLMINLMRSDYFTEVEMASIEEVELSQVKAYNYKLTATLHYLSDEELKKQLESQSGPDLLASF